jgi:hypothetical protein
MRQRVSQNNPDIQQETIHPQELFAQERQLAKEALAHIGLLTDPQLTPTACPFCGRSRHQASLLRRDPLVYCQCPGCDSLSLFPQPTLAMWQYYFLHSPLAQLRRSEVYQAQQEEWRTPLWEDWCDWMDARVRRYGQAGPHFACGVKYRGWLAFLGKHRGMPEAVQAPLLTPSSSIDQASDLPEGVFSLITALDALQRWPDPAEMLKALHQRLSPKGLLLLTCRLGTGFDVLALWDHSATIYPLDHLHLPSLQGLTGLLETLGFDVLEASTPGQLDVRLVQEQRAELSDQQRFLRYLMERGDALLMERFQTFLQENRLSSHLRLVARKKGASS